MICVAAASGAFHVVVMAVPLYGVDKVRSSLAGEVLDPSSNPWIDPHQDQMSDRGDLELSGPIQVSTRSE